MKIDLNKLPIPDWDLRCPNCDYLLNGLPSYKCPECAREFTIRSVILSSSRLRDPVYTGKELPLPDFGLVCRKCGHDLVGAARHECPQCAKGFDPLSLRPKGDWIVVEPWMRQGIPIELLGPILAEEYIPHIVQDNITALGVGWVSVTVASEFFFDMLHLMRRRALAAGGGK